MIPRHLLTRASKLSACPCRCHVTPKPLLSHFNSTRAISSTSTKWRPAAQLAEPDVDYEPTFNHPPLPPNLTSSSFSSSSLTGLDLHRPLIQLPEPLPSDITASPSDPRSALYPSTGVIDSMSMIDICLRRPEHVPRGFQIFRKLLEDAKGGSKRIPEAHVWGKVIEATARLGQDVNDRDLKSSLWRKRAQELVNRWETHHGTKGLNVLSGGHEDGIRIYQGWFAGSVG
jgi:hypothetical protein